jgi:protein TonB
MARGHRNVLTSAFAFRVAALMASALAHVLLYGALSLAPAWSPPPRAGLLVTDLLVTEPPAPAPRIPQLVTPPRPRVMPTPPKRPVEIAPPQSAANVEPPIERDVAEPPMVAAPPTVAARETAHEVIEAGPAPPVSEGARRGAISSVTTLSQPDAGLAVAGFPPAPPAAAAPGTLTRTAIPRGGYQITPSYPASARQLGVEGTALLSVFVDAAGHVGQVIVKQSAGHPDLDRAAADAVRRWRFEPARRGAEAVAMWVELPVEFRLR